MKTIVIVVFLTALFAMSCKEGKEKVEPKPNDTTQAGTQTPTTNGPAGSLPLDLIAYRIDTSRAGWKKNHLVVWRDSLVTFQNMRSQIRSVCAGSFGQDYNKFMDDPENYQTPVKIFSGTNLIWTSRQTQILDSMKKTFRAIKMSPPNATAIYGNFTGWVSDSLIAGSEIDLMRKWITDPQKRWEVITP